MRYFIAIVILILFSVQLRSQDAPSEVLKHTSYLLVKGDKLVRTDSVILQINERTGDNDAEITIPYKKGDKVTINDAWIEDMSGNIIRKLRSKDISDRSNISGSSLYADDWVKSFELKHSTYPYRIVYSLKISYARLLVIAALDDSYSQTPIKNGKLVVETLTAEPIRYKYKHINDFRTETIGNNTCYTWEYTYVPQPKELNKSQNTSATPTIDVLPLSFDYGEKGSWLSWQTFGNWIYVLNKDKDVLTLEEQTKIDKLLQHVTDNKEKAKILYKYMQDYTRYINVSMKIGGLQSFPASYVCQNKYGDCKALSNYMQAMLKYAGISSYYTLILSDNKVRDIDPTFATQAFNHVILTIPFGKDTTYLECTAKNTAFGYIHTSIQGRKALLIDKTDSHLIDIPALNADDVLCTRTIQADLNTSETTLTGHEKGENYELTSYLIGNIDKNTTDKYIRRNILSGSYELLDFKIEQPSRDTPSTTLKASLKFHNLSKMYGNNIIVTPFAIDIPTYENPNKRKTDVQLDYPQYYKDTIVYDIGDKKINKIPTNADMHTPFGHYSYKFGIADSNKLVVYKEVLIHAGRYSSDQYFGFYTFMQSLKTNENKNIYIEVQ